jgi:hydroxyacylglutathione hydrolase
MTIERIWTGNAWRNFNYLISCPETGEAMAVDPLEADKCLAAAKHGGFKITQLLNTHEHGDHTGGNRAIIAATGAKLLAHENARGKIPGIDYGLAGGDIIRVGQSVEIEVLDTPGHTMSHLCLLLRGKPPSLISGDTLFNAGAGNCHNGGDPAALYRTFVTQLARLPDETLVYPGHDYMTTNLAFTLDREPDNARAAALLAEIKDCEPGHGPVTTLALEKEINSFFRLQSPTVIERLHQSFPEIGERPDAETVFLKLRELRNSW